MATVSELIVLVSANTTNFQKGMAVSEASATRFGTVTKVAFGLAAVAAVKFVSDSVEAYNEHQEALLQLQTTIKNSPALIGASTQAFEKQATALQNLTGFQDEEILKADAVLGRFGLTADQLQEVNPLILDYARATGQDAATAAGSLGRALLGNTRALKAIGISFTATGDTAKDFDTIVSSLQSKVGGLSQAYGETLPGKLAIAAAEFDDVKEKVGEALIPTLKDLADLLVNLIPIFEKVATAMKFLPLIQMTQDFGSTDSAVQKFANGIIDTVPVLGYFVSSNEDLHNKLADLYKELGLNADGTRKLGTAADQTAADQDALAGAVEGVTADMQAQKQAAQQLAGGLLGLTADALDLAEKQRVVNKMQEEGHDSGKKYNEAVLDLLNSQEQFKNDIPAFIENLHHSGLSLQEAYDKVIQLGKGVGLTRQDVLDALGPLKQYKNALDGIPSSVTTHVNTIFTRTDVGGQGGNYHHPLAAGGIVMRPTMALVGESGPEAVIPLNKANQMAGITGDITLQIDGKTLARITRDELLKLGNRNAGTGL